MNNNPLREKVQKLYDIVGERGLYVNTNYDVFLKGHNSVKAGAAQQYEFFLLNPRQGICFTNAPCNPDLIAKPRNNAHHRSAGHRKNNRGGNCRAFFHRNTA